MVTDPQNSLSSNSLLILTLVLILLIGVFVHYQQQTIAVVAASAEETVFSGERAALQLQYLLSEGQPHSVDTKANRVVENRIVERLRALGYREEIQEAVSCLDSERGEVKFGFSRCVKVRNIIVHIPGTTNSKGILLSSHYDSVPAAPGASDAGAAVATLLEVARLLTISEAPRNSIVLLFNEGEETGLHGARAFMAQHPLAKQLQVAINIEARGTTSRSVLFETGEDSGWLVSHYAASTPAPLSSSLFYEIYKVLPNDTDLTIFKQYGLQGINFAHADNEPHYHTPLDNFENLDKGSLQHHGDNVWGVLGQIKDIDLSAVKKGNLVYTDVLGLVTISWPESWSVGVAIALTLFFVCICVLAYRQRWLSLRSLSLGLIALLLTLMLCVLATYGAQLLVQKISGHQQPWRANSLPMEIGVWSLCIGIGLLGGLWTKRLASATSVLLITLAWFLILTITSCLTLPGISYLFIIPLGISSLIVGIWMIVPNNKHLKILAFLSLPITSAIIFLPIAYFIEISISFQMSVVIGIFVGFVAIALLPLPTLLAVSGRSLRTICIGVLAISITAFVWTGVQAPYTSFKPQPLNLIYLQQDVLQQDSQAKIVVDAMENYIPPPLAQALGKTETGNVLPWTNASHRYLTTTSLDIQAIDTEIVRTETNEQGRTVTLNLRGNEHVGGTTLLIPKDSRLQTIEWLGQTASYLDAKPLVEDTLVYQCLGETCQDQSLRLYFLGTNNVSVAIASHYPGLPSPLIPFADTRDGLSVQRQNGDQTVILSEVSL